MFNNFLKGSLPFDIWDINESYTYNFCLFY